VTLLRRAYFPSRLSLCPLSPTCNPYPLLADPSSFWLGPWLHSPSPFRFLFFSPGAPLPLTPPLTSIFAPKGFTCVLTQLFLPPFSRLDFPSPAFVLQVGFFFSFLLSPAEKNASNFYCYCTVWLEVSPLAGSTFFPAPLFCESPSPPPR